MERFKSELNSNLIPIQFEDIKTYMVSMYLKKTKDEFVHNLIKEIIDMLLTKTRYLRSHYEDFYRRKKVRI